MASARLPLTAVNIDQRPRRDLGDLDELCRSLAEVGQLQPIAVTPDHQLLAGRRRLAAARKLGWETIAAHVVAGLDDALRMLHAERDENICRVPLRISERVELGCRLETLESKEARKRQGRRGQARSEKITEQAGRGQTRDKVGAALGLSGPTYERARAVITAAREDPERYAELVERMDRTGKVDGCYRALERLRYLAERDAQAKQVQDSCGIITGDFREAGRQVADASVDLLLTDPPYAAASLPLVEDLAAFAARVLVPGGICLVVTGQLYLPDVLAALTAHLTYVWTFCLAHTGGNNGIVRKVNLFQMWKPVVAFARPPVRVWWTTFADRIGVGRDKEECPHQQDVGGAEYLIEHLCPEGGTVCDPLCGSGSTLLAAARLGRRFVGIERDAAVAARARLRLAQTARRECAS
jgi:ParB-like chromosome segregation protein Spo0J